VSVTADLVTARKAAGFTRVYPIGAVPAGPTYPYVVVGYAPNAPTVRRLSGSGDPNERFTVQHFGRTADSVEDVATDTFTTFEGREINGAVCWQETATPLYRDPDAAGVLSTTHTYRF
jgi:hypothetical protein